MNRKLFTFLLFYLFSFLPLTATTASKGNFPWGGGMTSDSIKISKPKLDGFEFNKKNKNLQITDDSEYGIMEFDVTVPKGKTACLQCKMILKIFTNGKLKGNNKVTFTLNLDKKEKVKHSADNQLCYLSDRVNIPEGKHKVYMKASFKLADPTYTTGGSIDSLCIHIHDFSSASLSREALCGTSGESHAKCTVCGKDSTVIVRHQYDKHSLRAYVKPAFSCMTRLDSIYECEHCPHTEIHHTEGMTEHSYDQNGHCSACGLQLPKHNADTTVYYVYNAAEMRALAEMVSIGRIPGNIGVDLRSDLVFSKDMIMLPLGTFDNPFQGVFNGNGHRILGVTNAYQGIDCLGFIGVAKGTLLSHAVIANLIFDSSNILKGEACVGGIVGYATECDIVNCASFGLLEGTDNVGGIVGYADKQVSILNCASVATVKTKGKWNTMVCGMPLGHILNSYGAATNLQDGVFDELPTTALRHCFSSQGSGDGLTLVSQDALTSYRMVELLNAESESPCFMMSDNDIYPIPVASSTVGAKANRAIRTNRSAYIYARRAPSVAGDDNTKSEKDQGEIEIRNGYVDESAIELFGQTIEDVIYKDSVKYADLERLYIVSRSVPEGFDVYDYISGGELTAFESYILPADSSYISMREYEVLSSDRVQAQSETYGYADGNKKYIDQYTIGDNENYTLTARVIFKDNNDIIYQENDEGIMKPVWRIKTVYDDSDNPTAVYCYSYDRKTGETNLDYYNSFDGDSDDTDDTYTEYLDSLTNTIHLIYNFPDSTGGKNYTREHYILRASDQSPLEILEENVIDGVPYLTDGTYFVYDDNDDLVQSVAFGPEDPDTPTSKLRPYMYHQYIGAWPVNPYPTTTRIPSVEQPSLQKRMDANVYDMQGRVVRNVTDVKDPFSGLPRGLYIYQGKKYLKR